MAQTRVVPTVEEVDATLPAGCTRREVVDGVAILVTGESLAHGHVQVELGAELVLWARGSGAVVLGPNFDVRVTPSTARQPDLLMLLAEHRGLVRSDQVAGPPDLVVEILSPSTRRVDLVIKRGEYARLGVAEYWCVDPLAREAQLFSPPSGPPRVVQEGEHLTSPLLPGFDVPLARVLP